MKSPSTIVCARAPGPDACLPCLESFRLAEDEATCVEELFSGEKACRREYPHPSGLNLLWKDCLTPACVTSREGCLPWIVLCPETEPDDETVVASLRKELVHLVADLIAKFTQAARFTRMDPDHDKNDLIHNRQTLAAAQNPLPAQEDIEVDVFVAIKKRQELRLLPQDSGYPCWLVAKRDFCVRARLFLCRPEIVSGFELIVDVPILSGESHEDNVKEFLREYFPLKEIWIE
ncbi:hypothetical protein QBC40DRAFT_304604 [Triangularia verruculosa]|uniref:Uncharacterized protein n=1 Tax=Triangularia verruculosa TaxID=2587418 RepID=A0AAN6XPI5_9PEZI|nr:hypothetical protein QBC40DRAFT_304604 [Triangularia verruculosa]